jgi:hypothetical protein
MLYSYPIVNQDNVYTVTGHPLQSDIEKMVRWSVIDISHLAACCWLFYCASDGVLLTCFVVFAWSYLVPFASAAYHPFFKQVVCNVTVTLVACNVSLTPHFCSCTPHSCSLQRITHSLLL